MLNMKCANINPLGHKPLHGVPHIRTDRGVRYKGLFMVPRSRNTRTTQTL